MKTLSHGQKQLKKSLDVVQIVRRARALNTIMNLLFSKNERLLMRLQRRHILLDNEQ